jgi:hypothetical protein
MRGHGCSNGPNIIDCKAVQVNRSLPFFIFLDPLILYLISYAAEIF